MKKRNKQFFLFFILLILISSIVLAAPPFLETTGTAGAFVGLDLKVPIPTYLEVNEPFEFDIHVFNATNGVPMTTGITCYFHLYNKNGNHIFEGIDTVPAHTFDYSFNINSDNFSYIGEYYFIAQCEYEVQDIKTGGFLSSAFYTSTDGLEPFENKPALEVAVFFLLFGLALIFLILAHVFKEDSGSAIVYAFIAGTIFFIQGALIAFGSGEVPVGANTPFTMLLFILGLYCYIFGVMFSSYINKND